MFVVVACATWVLPQVPFYKNWMPYGYDLGGIALVMMYISFGFVSLGLYGLFLGGLSWRSDSVQSWQALKIGSAAISLGLGLIWCYLALMELNLSVLNTGS